MTKQMAEGASSMDTTIKDTEAALRVEAKQQSKDQQQM
jgi:hypothetical protein